MNETRQLLGKLKRLMNLMQRLQSKECKNLGFSMISGQGRLLNTLFQQDGLTQKELSEILGIRPSSAGELVKKLEDRDLLTRKVNPKDRRVMNVFLTLKGRDFIANKPSFQPVLFKGVTEEEKQVFNSVLLRMLDSLEQEYTSVSEGEGESFLQNECVKCCNKEQVIDCRSCWKHNNS